MIGAERVREYPVVAFKNTDGAQRWDVRTGENEYQLWERAKSEVRYPGWGVAVLMECYASDKGRVPRAAEGDLKVLSLCA